MGASEVLHWGLWALPPPATPLSPSTPFLASVSEDCSLAVLDSGLSEV